MEELEKAIGVRWVQRDKHWLYDDDQYWQVAVAKATGAETLPPPAPEGEAGPAAKNLDQLQRLYIGETWERPRYFATCGKRENGAVSSTCRTCTVLAFISCFDTADKIPSTVLEGAASYLRGAGRAMFHTVSSNAKEWPEGAIESSDQYCCS